MIDSNIIYLSYGRISEYRRAVFSILSFFAWSNSGVKNTRIIIYTDKPEFFEPYLGDLNVEYFLLDDAIKEEMLAGKGFLHRVKVAVVDRTFKRYPDQNLILIDSDTFLVADFSPIMKRLTPGKSLMHKREYDLKAGLASFTSFGQGHFPKAFLDHINKRVYMINGKSEKFGHKDYSWNSGVVGLTKELAIYLPFFYQLTDEFYEHSKWFISEQLAFSLILQRRTEIIAADSAILHYWGSRQKIVVDGLLEQLFGRNNTAELRNPIFIRWLTKKWNAAVELDLILEQVTIAVSLKSWFYAAKKSIQAILKKPVEAKVYKTLILIYTGKL